MLILGLTKTTLLDYPGKIAATIFTGGCNFRCPYCHNGELVVGFENREEYSLEEIKQFLNKRKNVLDGVCISGGEPTIQKDLVEFAKMIKELGLLLKIDTNGSNCNAIEQLINMNLVDYIAMDIKTTIDKYKELTGCNDNELLNIDNTKKLLMSSKIDYEFRTTLIREYHNFDILKELMKYLDGCPKWYLQNYKASEYVLKKGLSGFDNNEIKNMRDKLKSENIFIRGID